MEFLVKLHACDGRQAMYAYMKFISTSTLNLWLRNEENGCYAKK